MCLYIFRSGCLFLILLAILENPLYSQGNKQKSIYIVNDRTRMPVQYAFVQSAKIDFTATADENGFISLGTLSAVAKNLLISCVGYQSKSIDIDTLLFSNDVAIVSLESKISSLAEIKIMSSANNGMFKTISDLDIHLRPINNSQEVLRMVPGLFIGQHAGGGKAEQVFLRGFDIDHGTDINISVDGTPVNMVSHAHGQGYADLHFVIPELIEKVNFNKGPYFADKGNFTTAGFVEFKTKDYLEQNFIKAELGQFNTLRGIAGINLIKPKAGRTRRSLYVAAEGSHTRGYFDSPQDFGRFNGVLKYHGSISTNSTLSAAISGLSSQWNASGQIPARAVASGLVGFYGAIDNTEGGETSRINTNVQLLTNLNNGGSIRNQVYYTKYKFELYSNFTFYKEDPVNGDQIRQKESRSILGYNGSYQKNYLLAGLKTETRTGVQLRYDDIDDIELSRTKNRSEINKQLMLGNIDELNAALYLSQRVSLSNAFDVTGAVRADYFSNSYSDKLLRKTLSSHAGIVSPKLNFHYRASDKVQLYLYTGRGFHSNDTRVAVQQNGRKTMPPAYGADFGGIFKARKNLVLQSAFWYLWLDQEFVYVGDEGIVEPGGQTQRSGFDISARYEVLKNLFADVDMSLSSPRALDVPKNKSYLPLAPRFTSVGGLTWRKEHGWNGSLRYRFMDNRPASVDNTVIAKGYFVVDAALNYTGKKWESGLAVQNILDAKWKETQFNTESRLQNEPEPVSEIHFTPGTPFFARLSFTVLF